MAQALRNAIEHAEKKTVHRGWAVTISANIISVTMFLYSAENSPFIKSTQCDAILNTLDESLTEGLGSPIHSALFCPIAPILPAAVASPMSLLFASSSPDLCAYRINQWLESRLSHVTKGKFSWVITYCSTHRLGDWFQPVFADNTQGHSSQQSLQFAIDAQLLMFSSSAPGSQRNEPACGSDLH